jgi:DNA gyrase subunit B
MTTSIEVLKDLEHIRHRHTMYADGVDHSTKEAIDNVIDEYQAGACTYLGITLDTETNQIIIADNGRGIPVDLHETEKISKMAVVFTKLHSSGKYKNREINNYNNTIGLNGVGIKVTSATSELFEAWTKKKSKTFKVVVERGVLRQTKDGSGIVPDKLPQLPFHEKVLSTVLRYNPDPTVFGVKYCRISSDYLRDLCGSLQYLCPNLSIELIIDGVRSTYISNRGISGLLAPKDSDHECKRFLIGSDALNLVLWWNPNEDGESIISYVNCQKTKDGGTHVNALRSAITEAFGDAGKVLSAYIKEGLRCAFHLKISDPQFQGQNKHRLLNPEASDLINKQVTRNLELFLTENIKIRDAILQRASALKKAHETFKKDKEAIKNLTKGKSRSLSLPDKLISASRCLPEQRELFICLHGNTKVRLADGSTPTIKEMAENSTKDYYGFTYDSSKDWVGVTRLLHPRQTQENAELLTITLDNGTSFTCTPNHLILRRDNLMVRADELSIGISLRQCTVTEKDGYLKVSQSSTWGSRSYFVHRLMYQAFNTDVVLSTRYDVHHLDENKLNNVLENLQMLSHQEHSRIHGICAKYMTDTRNKEKISQSAKRVMANPAVRQHLSKKAKEQWVDLDLRRWRAETTRQQFTDITAVNKKAFLECCRLVVLEHQNLTGDLYKEVASKYQLKVPSYYNHAAKFYRNKENVFLALAKEYGIDADVYIRANYHKAMRILVRAYEKGKAIGFKCDYKEEKDELRIDVDVPWQIQKAYPNLNIKSGSVALLKEVICYKKTYNHKIVKIERTTSAPVYCLTVPETKNFLLANGIFVHNCEGNSAANPIIQARTRPLYQEVYMLKGKITNACRVEMGKVLANADIIGIIQSIGCGVLEDCDPKKARVGKVLLISDADFDGRHIDALLISFFIIYMAPMVEDGRIYRVKSPLYVATYREQHWYGTGLSDQAALTDVKSKIPDNLKNKIGRQDGVNITRFKGHGAASAEAIRDYALGSKRELEVIRLPSGDADLVSSLMGDDVTARKELLSIDW